MPLGTDFLGLAGELLDASQMLKAFHDVEFNESQLTQSRYPTENIYIFLFNISNLNLCFISALFK